MNTIVNAIDTHILEQIQLSTNVKNIARHSTLLDKYTLQDDIGNACEVSSPTRDSNLLHNHHSKLKASSITENLQEWSTTGIFFSNRRGNKNNHSNFNTPMPDDNIDSNQPIIQQAYAYRELQCTGKRHNADYNKKYKETSRESFGFSTVAGNNKQLENDNNDESYALKWVSGNDHKFKKYISIQPVLVDKEPNASVHNIDTYIVQHLHQIRIINIQYKGKKRLTQPRPKIRILLQ